VVHYFSATQWVSYPIERVFAFFADPSNLPRITDPNMKLRIDELRLWPAPANPAIARVCPSSANAGAGSEIALSLRPFRFFPLRMDWKARVVDFEWNTYFVDEQISGPFVFFRHRHDFMPRQEHGVDGTTVVDQIQYRLPLGALGLAAAPLVHHALASGFASRQQRLPELLAK